MKTPLLRSGTPLSRAGFFGSLQRWIESLEFDSCQVSTELPIDFGVVLIALGLPGGDFMAQDFNIWNPAIQTLCGEDREFALLG
jgi:hypothetical protein